MFLSLCLSTYLLIYGANFPQELRNSSWVASFCGEDLTRHGIKKRNISPHHPASASQIWGVGYSFPIEFRMKSNSSLHVYIYMYIKSGRHGTNSGGGVFLLQWKFSWGIQPISFSTKNFPVFLLHGPVSEVSLNWTQCVRRRFWCLSAFPRSQDAE